MNSDLKIVHTFIKQTSIEHEQCIFELKIEKLL